MKFCSNCDNMYYLQILDNSDSKDNNDKLIYYCRNCGNKDTNIEKDNIVVSITNVKQTEQKYNHIINKYTKLDPTLPRISNINCPNPSCSSNKDDDDELKTTNEIIYIRYDNSNLKYAYICSNCDTIWNNN
jgi:DNA-directed RNA polymerase subunit M/transcription elongation factor TFIIS